MPLLLILGEKDGVNTKSPSVICERLATCIPKLNCEILDDAGHLWGPKHFESAGGLIDKFLESAT